MYSSSCQLQLLTWSTQSRAQSPTDLQAQKVQVCHSLRVGHSDRPKHSPSLTHIHLYSPFFYLSNHPSTRAFHSHTHRPYQPTPQPHPHPHPHANTSFTTFRNGRYCVFLSIIDLFNSICLSLVPVWLALDDVLFLDCRSSGHDLQIRRRYPQRYASSCPPHAQIHTHTHTLKRGSLLHNPSMLGTGGIVARVSHPKLVCAELPRRIEFWGGSGHVER